MLTALTGSFIVFQTFILGKETNALKTINTFAALVLMLALVGCKSRSTENRSDALVASNLNTAMEALSSDGFCVEGENEDTTSCEAALRKFLNSPQFQGKELIISCAGGSQGFVYDASKGGGATLDAGLAEQLSKLFSNPNTNKNILEKRCSIGVRGA